jgi:hypothetical protein
LVPEVIMVGERSVQVVSIIGKDDAAHVGERPVRIVDMIRKNGDAAHRFSSSVTQQSANNNMNQKIALLCKFSSSYTDSAATQQSANLLATQKIAAASAAPVQTW